ncbi:unnamed protein product [Rhizophagus irregularis]|nr:unnamed protein product [Rhizophagus irregularis]
MRPGVSNRLLEYLCFLNMSVSGKNVTHRNWIDTLSDIWKNHPVARIQKLADKSIKNYQNEIKSQAVLKFWTDIEKAKLRNKLYSIHFNGFAELHNELQDIQVENSDKSAGNTESGFDNDEEPYEEEHFAHIIDLDKVTERDRPPFLNITESQLPSIKLPKSVEQQLDYYLAETTIEKIWESFESYKIVNSDDELYTRKSRGSLYFLSRETTRAMCEYMSGGRRARSSRAGVKYFDEFRTHFWERPEDSFDRIRNINISNCRRNRRNSSSTPSIGEVEQTLGQRSSSRRHGDWVVEVAMFAPIFLGFPPSSSLWAKDGA